MPRILRRANLVRNNNGVPSAKRIPARLEITATTGTNTATSANQNNNCIAVAAVINGNTTTNADIQPISNPINTSQLTSLQIVQAT